MGRKTSRTCTPAMRSASQSESKAKPAEDREREREKANVTGTSTLQETGTLAQSIALSPAPLTRFPLTLTPFPLPLHAPSTGPTRAIPKRTDSWVDEGDFTQGSATEAFGPLANYYPSPLHPNGRTLVSPLTRSRLREGRFRRGASDEEERCRATSGSRVGPEDGGGTSFGAGVWRPASQFRWHWDRRRRGVQVDRDWVASPAFD